MSQPLSRDRILWHQRLWASEGLYDGKLDGLHGPKTERAERAFDERARELRRLYGEFDRQTERSLATLTLSGQKYARSVQRKWAALGYLTRILSGSRTYDQQNVLYAIGRTAEMHRRPVTNARGGQSFHNFGVAFDIGLFAPDGSYLGNGFEDRYDDAAYAMRDYLEGDDAPLDWGGWWKKPDRPHYALALGCHWDELAAEFERGRLFDVLLPIAA